MSHSFSPIGPNLAGPDSEGSISPILRTTLANTGVDGGGANSGAIRYRQGTPVLDVYEFTPVAADRSDQVKSQAAHFLKYGGFKNVRDK